MHEIKNKDTRDLVNRAIGKELGEPVAVESMLQVLANENISLPLVKPLSGLKVACYYGCLLARPPEVVGIDNAENPQIMDKLIGRLGAEAVEHRRNLAATSRAGLRVSLTNGLADLAAPPFAREIAIHDQQPVAAILGVSRALGLTIDQPPVRSRCRIAPAPEM